MPSGDDIAPGQPAVSVLMPTYDRARFLGAAVDSVLAQSFADLELLVIDDGSSDETAAVLSARRDGRLRVLRRAHHGLRPALNAGLRAARGRYIARNDSDDVWLPDLLATLVPVLEADPSLGMAYGRAELMDAAGQRLPGFRGSALRHPDDPLRSLLHTDYSASITSVMRRSAIAQAGGWCETLRTSEDWEMALRVAQRHGVRFVDRVVARIRLHGGNSIAARSYAARALPDRLAIVERVLRDPATPRHIAAQAPRFRRDVYIGTALQHADLGEHGAALRMAGRALAAGGNPLRSAARIAWAAFSWRVIARYGWSRALAARILGRVRAGSRANSGAAA
jgi:glycosyltransferase involved in cell wall biosynthesis